MKFKNFYITIWIILLAACSSELPTADGTFPISSLTTTKANIVPIFTTTRIALSTKTPSPTIPPTNIMSVATSNAIATTEAIRIQLIGKYPQLENYNAFCHETDCYGVEVSSNGKYVYFSDGNVIELFNITGKRVGKYSFREISGRFDVLEGYLDSVHWSNDGRYLYLATQFGDGGPGPYFGYKYSLARVNLENGTWKDTGISGVLSFSPNEKYVVYSANENEIRIRNLQSGEEKVYFTPEYYMYFGDLAWSPDNGKVIFVATSDNWDDVDSKFALFMIHLEGDVNVKLLYEDVMPFYYPVRWSEKNKISLNKFEGFGEWTLDLSVDPPTVHP